MTENTIKLSLFMMRGFIFEKKKKSNNTYTQCSNARLLSSDG